jgi:FAD-linked oxidoreductase
MFTINPGRRALLKALSLAPAAVLLPARLRAAADNALSWQNWSGNQRCAPQAIHYPSDAAQLAEIIRNSSGRIRCFGGSHSFSPVVPTDDTLVSLEAMSGLLGHDPDTLTATFAAGTRIGMASAANYKVGQSFTNEPDINLQSLAGALATSTHGTGAALPALPGMVESLRLMTASGEHLSLSAADGDLFRAACCNVGALGVVTEITFHNEPAYRLEEKTSVMPLRDAMDMIEREKDQQRNIEFFAFPHGESAIVKVTNLTDEPDTPVEAEDSNELLEMACEVSMRAPWLTGMIQKAVTFFVEDTVRRGPAWQIYANKRAVMFNEMEYTVPAEQGLACLEQVCDTIRSQDINVFFPIEFRYTAADNSLIGMFSERPGCSISVHQYHRQDYAPLFNAVEPIFHQHAGRPHWGKLHSMDVAALRGVYPHLDRFREIRAQLDPTGKFLNPHLESIFGVQA